jgi:D-tyrosyl-tRNA(Tyr) deacylase
LKLILIEIRIWRAVLKAILQRVTKASVTVENEVVGKIGPGLVILIGIARDDTEKDATYLADKIINLRIFADKARKFNLSSLEAGADILIISQFTLLADSRKGRRPSFEAAASPEMAERLVNFFTDRVSSTDLNVQTGRFQQHMIVEIYNDGPVTIVLDSRDKIH